MMRIEKTADLLGVDKFGDCISCGSNKNILKVTFCIEDGVQQNSIKICSKCSELLIRALENNTNKSKAELKLEKKYKDYDDTTRRRLINEEMRMQNLHNSIQ